MFVGIHSLNTGYIRFLILLKVPFLKEQLALSSISRSFVIGNKMLWKSIFWFP